MPVRAFRRLVGLMLIVAVASFASGCESASVGVGIGVGLPYSGYHPGVWGPGTVGVGGPVLY